QGGPAQLSGMGRADAHADRPGDAQCCHRRSAAERLLAREQHPRYARHRSAGASMPISLNHLWLGLWAIAWREIAKFLRQTERLLSALVRPALWLLVFATGLHDLLGVSIIPPYETYTPYQEYILPGLMGIVILFQCMQSALSMVYDREAGVMRVMLVSPLPRAYLLFAKIVGATILSMLQVYAFLLLARLFGYGLPAIGYLTIMPAIIAAG